MQQCLEERAGECSKTSCFSRVRSLKIIITCFIEIDNLGLENIAAVLPGSQEISEESFLLYSLVCKHIEWLTTELHNSTLLP